MGHVGTLRDRQGYRINMRLLNPRRKLTPTSRRKSG
jgi:hypothetical protein